LKQNIKPDKLPDVTIKKIVPQGYGLGFLEGWTVFVPLTAGGDRVKVKVNHIKGKTIFGEIFEIIEPSKDRRKPPCVYFGQCGGCDFQHLEYRAQLVAKLGILEDCLKRIGKIDFAGKIEVIASPQEFGYRSRTQWQADKKSGKIGYFKRHSHEIIDVKTCPVLTDELQKTLTLWREKLQREDFPEDKIKIEVAGAGGKVSVYSSEIIEPTEDISFSFGGNYFFYDAQSFFQGNLLLVEKLVETALKNASGKIALDLYCGVGLFTLPLASKFEKVIGVEANRRAIEMAQRNLECARIGNVRVFAEDVSEWLAAENQISADFILLDPPRSGTEKGTIEKVLDIRPKEISYVSCEPSVLARDLRILCERFYEIQSITALDLFPQTHHVETVVRLRQKKRT
jgi:23S rRNA (uracil1939-C5)-methyltransferase